jgi:hypothetical protein
VAAGLQLLQQMQVKLTGANNNLQATGSMCQAAMQKKACCFLAEESMLLALSESAVQGRAMLLHQVVPTGLVSLHMRSKDDGSVFTALLYTLVLSLPVQPTHHIANSQQERQQLQAQQCSHTFHWNGTVAACSARCCSHCCCRCCSHCWFGAFWCQQRCEYVW